jgi:hypothetical protein
LTQFRPVLQLDDVAKARPEITKAVENMVSKGKWTVPGYTESEYYTACTMNFGVYADGLRGHLRPVWQSSE